MPAFVRNATVKVRNAVHHFLAPYYEDNQVDVANRENQIRIESDYYPVMGSMDVRVFNPQSNTFYHSIDVHPAAEILLAERFTDDTASIFAASGAPSFGFLFVCLFFFVIHGALIERDV